MPLVGDRRAAQVLMLVLLLVLSFVFVSLSLIGTVKAENNSLVTVNDEHFIIQEVLGMFRNFFAGSFNATTGYWIEINLSSSSTSNDPFLVYLNILSANHGTIFSAKGKEFSQTVYLDYEDVYNITIAKSPFYSSVRINGIIDVFHQEPVGKSSSENWVEVTRFTEDDKFFQTEPFTIEHVEWRIRWEYEPDPEVPEEHPAFYVYVYSQESPGTYFETILKKGTNETNGTLYIHNRNGTFFLIVIRAVISFTLIIEQDLTSIPEFPSWIIPPLFVTTTLVIVIFKKRKKSKSRNYL